MSFQNLSLPIPFVPGNFSRSRRGAFTLIQLLVTLAIIGLLSAILLPVFTRSRAAARRAQCDVKLKAISLALDAFKQENGKYPANLGELRDKGYLTDAQALHCPADLRSGDSYSDFYTLRAPGDNEELPVVTCPFHEETGKGAQARLGRFTTQFSTKPAVLSAANGVQVKSPGKNAISGYVGQVVHGGDILTTNSSGRATVTFADNSTADIESDAEITVLQSFVDGQSGAPLYTIVRQVVGVATYTVNHGSRFDVSTPAATAGARGTKFTVTVLNTATQPNTALSSTKLYVINGKVVFTSGTKSGLAPVGQLIDGLGIGGLLRFLF